jgi:hypothetical protein
VEEQLLRRFNDESLRGSAHDLEGITAVRCTIAGRMPLPECPGAWNRLRDCRAEQCRHENVTLSGVAIERCELDGLGRAGRNPLFLWACVYREVRLRGRLTGLKINPEYGIRRDPGRQAQWAEAMRTFYRDVAWALDISEAEFTSTPTLEAIPGHLVRRDPSRQVLVRRAALAGREIRSLPRRIALEWFIERSPFDSVVIAGSGRKGHRQADLDDMMRLRDMGIAEAE